MEYYIRKVLPVLNLLSGVYKFNKIVTEYQKIKFYLFIY